MPAVGKLEIKVDKDIAANTGVSLSELLPLPERSERYKKFVLEAGVTRDKTALKLTVAGVGTYDILAAVTAKKGETTTLWQLAQMVDWVKRVNTSKAIKKGAVLAVTIETA